MKRFTLISALAIILSSGAAQAASFTNGSFETSLSNPGGFTTLNSGNTDIAGWQVVSGSVDYIGNYWAAADGSRSIDMDGNNPGAIRQTFDTVMNQKYTVTFDLAGNPDVGSLKTLGASIDGGLVQTSTFDSTGHSKGSTSGMGWTEESFTFTAASPSTSLTFASLDNSNSAWGPALDNVNVTLAGAPVPEPGTMMLLGAGLLGLTIYAKRRKNA